MAEKNLIKIYVDASSAKRVDIIIKHYTDFLGIVDGYTEGLRYMIECEKESNSHRALGDLGVRVQTGGTTSDPTAKKAIRNVMTREALINCDFSGDVMEGVYFNNRQRRAVCEREAQPAQPQCGHQCRKAGERGDRFV